MAQFPPVALSCTMRIISLVDAAAAAAAVARLQATCVTSRSSQPVDCTWSAVPPRSACASAQEPRQRTPHTWWQPWQASGLTDQHQALLAAAPLSRRHSVTQLPLPLRASHFPLPPHPVRSCPASTASTWRNLLLSTGNGRCRWVGPLLERRRQQLPR